MTKIFTGDGGETWSTRDGGDLPESRIRADNKCQIRADHKCKVCGSGLVMLIEEQEHVISVVSRCPNGCHDGKPRERH